MEVKLWYIHERFIVYSNNLFCDTVSNFIKITYYGTVSQFIVWEGTAVSAVGKNLTSRGKTALSPTKQLNRSYNSFVLRNLGCTFSFRAFYSLKKPNGIWSARSVQHFHSHRNTFFDWFCFDIFVFATKRKFLPSFLVTFESHLNREFQ